MRVRPRRGGDGDGVHLGVGQHLVEGGGDLDGRVVAEDPAGPIDVEVAEPAQPEGGRGLEVADEVGAPVAGPDDGDADRRAGRG
jgi:hypothetical protein